MMVLHHICTLEGDHPARTSRVCPPNTIRNLYLRLFLPCQYMRYDSHSTMLIMLRYNANAIRNCQAALLAFVVAEKRWQPFQSQKWRVALKDHMGLDNNVELFELTDATLCDLDRMHATLSKEHEAWDLQQLKPSIHSLKGTMGMVGFTPLYGTCIS